MPTTFITSPTTMKPVNQIVQKRRQKQHIGTMKLATILICTVSLIACLFPIRHAEAGRLQDFIQNLVGGRDNSNSNSNSNGNSNSGNSNSNSNFNSDSNSDSDAAATGDQDSQQLTPMMSAMNPFMRYPSFYDSFSPASYGGYPGMSFSNPMGAMSGLSPMAAMSSNSIGATFSPASFGPASFGTFGSSPSVSNPMSAFGTSNGMSASSLSNIYASSPSLMGGYAPYYGRR